MKKKYELSMKIFLIGSIFWVLETVIFLTIEGWHWKAISPMEIMCDKIVTYTFGVALFFWFLSINDLMRKLNKDI